MLVATVAPASRHTRRSAFERNSSRAQQTHTWARGTAVPPARAQGRGEGQLQAAQHTGGSRAVAAHCPPAGALAEVYLLRAALGRRSWRSIGCFIDRHPLEGPGIDLAPGPCRIPRKTTTQKHLLLAAGDLNNPRGSATGLGRHLSCKPSSRCSKMPQSLRS